MSEFVPKSFQIGIAVLIVATGTWFYSRRRRWVHVGRLSNIYLYPLKSGRFRELNEAECTSLGLRYIVDKDKAPLRDRVFVVYDVETQQFISGKLNPMLMFITVEPKTSDTVVFSYPDKPSVEVVLPEKFSKDSIKLWSPEKVRTVDCGDQIARWVSEIVRGSSNICLRVGYWPESETWRRDVESCRPNEVRVFKKLSNQFTGAYSDLSGYLLINYNSITELNSRLDETDKCEALNFRPNLVIEGPEAFEEDKWDWIKIGDAVFRTFRPCTRCRFTTINPHTGEINANLEPTKTLRKYRTMEKLGESRVDPKIPVMGVYIGLIQPGKIKAGDNVYISA